MDLEEALSRIAFLEGQVEKLQAQRAWKPKSFKVEGQLTAVEYDEQANVLVILMPQGKIALPFGDDLKICTYLPEEESDEAEVV